MRARPRRVISVKRKDFVPFLIILLAVALATFALVAPGQFGKLKDWQTLTASLIALVAATVAYRGAMARVELDERIIAQSERRKLLGVLLRLDFAMDTLKYEADEILSGLAIPSDPAGNTVLAVDETSLSELSELKEAWDNLDLFPSDLTRSVYNVQNELYNFKQFKADQAGETYPIEHGIKMPPDVDYLRTILVDLSASCETGLAKARAEIDKTKPPQPA
jgi:hypothetical protein